MFSSLKSRFPRLRSCTLPSREAVFVPFFFSIRLRVGLIYNSSKKSRLFFPRGNLAPPGPEERLPAARFLFIRFAPPSSHFPRSFPRRDDLWSAARFR